MANDFMNERPVFQTPVESAESRLHRDPIFASIVYQLVAFLEIDGSRTFTPTEVREAAILACCIYESRHIRPLVVPHTAINGK